MIPRNCLINGNAVLEGIPNHEAPRVSISRYLSNPMAVPFSPKLLGIYLYLGCKPTDNGGSKYL
jgi:hypothetical protein